VGDVVRYVVNRNINYTNICTYRCGFCAFSKGKMADNLRGRPYLVDLDEVSRRTAEAWDRGASEVCMQGGIHPSFSGQTYLELLAAAKRGAPGIHVHAFSPLEVVHGAETLGLAVPAYLERLRDAGLGSLPGTAAEILADRARAILCPDKLTTQGWLDVIGAAHRVGLPTTSTMMFGHVDTPDDWAAHLLALRDLQAASGGITEFVPLPFVHMEAPIYYRGQARQGPTLRETLLVHAVARLVLHPLIPNIQVSWCKMGPEGVVAALAAGVNDLGGTLMNESISRAAGTEHGQELPPAGMDALIRRAGRQPQQRSTLYGSVNPAQEARSRNAADLAPLITGEITPRRTRRTA
jgi:FO synthase